MDKEPTIQENKNDGNCCCFLMGAAAIIVLVLLLPLIWGILSAIIIGIAAFVGISTLAALFFPIFLMKVVLIGLLVYAIVRIVKILKNR